MQKNNVEMLEEIEKDLEVSTEETPELKEYEKLLLEERDRRDLEKAKSLIDAGCFSIVENEPTLDMSKLEYVPSKRKFKGLYDLYRNVETHELLYVSPLVEDINEDKKNIKPYGYKVLYIESMDAETYEMVIKAAKNNIKNSVSKVYKLAFILYFTILAITLFNVVYIFINTLSTGILAAFAAIIYNCDAYLVGMLIATILLVPMMIKYKKYKVE